MHDRAFFADFERVSTTKGARCAPKTVEKFSVAGRDSPKNEEVARFLHKTRPFGSQKSRVLQNSTPVFIVSGVKILSMNAVV